MAKKITVTRKENKLVWGLHSLPIADGEKYGYSALDKVIYVADENTINVYKIDAPKKAVATRAYKNTKILRLFRGRGYVFFQYCYTDENGNLEYYQGRLTPNAGCTDLVALNRTDAEGNLIDFIEKDKSEEAEAETANDEEPTTTEGADKSEKVELKKEVVPEKKETATANKVEEMTVDMDDDDDEDSLM